MRGSKIAARCMQYLPEWWACANFQPCIKLHHHQLQSGSIASVYRLQRYMVLGYDTYLDTIHDTMHHYIQLFALVVHLNRTALSQSEMSNFFMFLLKC